MFDVNNLNTEEEKCLNTVDFYSKEGKWSEIKSLHKFFESHLGVIDRKISAIFSITAVFISVSGFILVNYSKIIEISRISLFFYTNGIVNLYFGILCSVIALKVRWISLALPCSLNDEKFDGYQDGCNPRDCTSKLLIVRKEKTFFLHSSMWLLLIGMFEIFLSILIIILLPK